MRTSLPSVHFFSPIEYLFRSGLPSNRLRPIFSVPPKQYLIEGVTRAGKVFRPSDWAERLCGVMSPFRPAGQQPRVGGHLQYSPYVHPMMVGSVKCVVVDERLDDIEPMAMEFVRNFARDNDLPFVEACILDEPPIKNP